VEAGGEPQEARGEQLDEVVADAVRDGLVERAFVPVRPGVELQALQLHAFAVRDVVEEKRREIRLVRHGAQTGELGNLHPDQVVAMRTGIRKTFQGFARLRSHFSGAAATMKMVL